LKLRFANKPKLEGKVLIYITRPNVYGVYPATLAARKLDDLYTLAYQLTDGFEQGEIKRIEGGFCLERFLLEPPNPKEHDGDTMTAEIVAGDEIHFEYSKDMSEEEIQARLEEARDHFFHHALTFAASAYVFECENKKDSQKEPFPNYQQCTKQEFLNLFDELHEGLVEAGTHDEGFAITLNLMQLCEKAPFSDTIVPSMCGIANNGHPRREEILGLYNTLVHCLVDQEFELAAEINGKIKQAKRFDYRTGYFKERSVRNNSFILPKQIAEDICRNMEAAQILECAEDCIIMRAPREDEYAPGIDSAFLVQTPPKRTTVEIPEDMAEQAGINGKVDIFCYKDRVEIYAK
jgi:hypothetical protein